jgi:hypothetical protein
MTNNPNGRDGDKSREDKFVEPLDFEGLKKPPPKPVWPRGWKRKRKKS